MQYMHNNALGEKMTYQEAIEQIRTIIPNEQILISQKEVSLLTGVSVKALNKDVREKKGIPHKVIRGKVFYAVTDVAKWMSDMVQTV